MHRRSLHLIIAFAWLLSLAGCQGLPARVPDTLELVGEFTYRDGQAVFTVLPGWSSPYIVYRKQPVRVEGQQVTIDLTDVSIDVTPPRPLIVLPEIGKSADVTRTATFRLPVNYRIAEKVEAQEFVEGKWETFSEFDAHSTPTANIGIAVIVDSSKSIDRQLGLAKSAAAYLSDTLARRWKDHTWLSVVPLDPAAEYLGFTTDKEIAKNFIAQIAVTPYTPLYDAMTRACDAFDAFEQNQAETGSGFTFDKRWILLFSDGQDNYSVQQLASLRRRLAQSNVSVFAVGIEARDRLDKEDLSPLAQERFVALSGLPREQLRERETQIIDTIVAQSPALYAVTYLRNDQFIDAPRKIKLIFTVEK